MTKLPYKPIVGRSIGRHEGSLEFGKYPISARMGPRYLLACEATLQVIDSEKMKEKELACISEAKGMYNRVLRQDTPDWEAVRHLLGEPDRAICHLAANWFTSLRQLGKSGQALNDHLNQPLARGIRAALFQAHEALRKAGFLEK